jgi:hypothetical protein
VQMSDVVKILKTIKPLNVAFIITAL